MKWDKGLWLLVVLLLTGAGLFSCRTLPPSPATVNEQAKRYTLKDFSIALPGSDDWSPQTQGENTITFFKRVDTASAHSLVAGVKQFVPPTLPKNKEEFEKLLKDSLGKEQEDSKRFRNTILQVTPDNRFGEYSIFVHSALKDFSPAQLPSNTEYMALTIYAYYLKLPKTDTYLYVWYSERSRPDDRDVNLRGKADQFFQTLQLKPWETKP
jgi:hypothetical protein